MYVYINGFWGGFCERANGVHYGIFETILKSVFNTPIHITSNPNDADILLESHFASPKIFYKEWKYSIFFTGEGVESKKLENSEKYTVVLGCQDTGRNFVSLPLYVAYDYCTPSSYPLPTVVPHKGICSIISSNIPGAYRYDFLDLLEEQQIPIDNAGAYKNTIAHKVEGNYYSRPILDFQSGYRMVLALENAKLDNYITEKIVNPFRAGTIPVYYGSDKICEYFNKDRFVIVDQKNPEEAIAEMKRLLTDDIYWLEKVKTPIFKKTTDEILQTIILDMSHIISQYDVEVICNAHKEDNRLQTLQPILKYYSIQPSYTVWGEGAREHQLYPTYAMGTDINGVSLAINHVELIKQHSTSDKFLLLLESDVMPLHDMKYIDSEIKKTIQEMKTHSIDFVFLGKGCFMNTISLDDPRFNFIKMTDTLFKTEGSRCTESYIISPSGIRKFLEYYNSIDDHTAIDYEYNFFFKMKYATSCWKIPELFKQGTHTGVYNSQIVSSKLPERFNRFYT